ncbi:MAG: RNA-protein complex protein Nop10 [Candidatus Bathyarchaeia archaeon]
MRWQIRRCTKCGEYTLKETCPRCYVDTKSPVPPKFSPSDKYARYRIQGLINHENYDNRRKDEAA